MDRKSTQVLLPGFVAALLLIAFAAAAYAQDDMETDDALSPSRFVFLGRMGGGQAAGGGQFQFDRVPDGLEDETTYSTTAGYAATGGAEFWWFPTSGRSFQLSVSLLNQTGYGAIKSDDDDDYGAGVIDKKSVRYHMNMLLLGLGYRFLYGARDNYGTSLGLKFGGGGADIIIDDLTSGTGSNAVFELGANFFKRFDNDFLIGVQWDIRMWSMWAKGAEMKYMNTDADLAYGGGASFFSVIGGWELI